VELKNFLTNEKIKKRFVSQFDLVTYAIKLATNMIQTGRDSRVKCDSQNRTMHVLTEILNGKDQLDLIIEDEPEQLDNKDYHKNSNKDYHKNSEQAEEESTGKTRLRKKPRKILAE